MNYIQIEHNLKNLVSSINEETFVYEFLTAYGVPKATIKLLKDGKHNISKKENQIILKKKLLFQEVPDGQDIHALIDSLNKDESSHKHAPRFIVVTDYKTLLAIDTKTKESLDIPIDRLDKHFDFFLPWAWMEKSKYKAENPADIKAAYTLAKLYDAIREDNNITSSEDTHALNVFLSRILFCFFAEDTDIFPEDIFTYSLESHTQLDGSDLNSYLERLFKILNKPEGKRWQIPDYLDKFPYVNGGLFEKEFKIPVFKRKSRNILIECGRDLNWSEINPDIFGSMVQAVVHPDQRSGLGMHYTSVPNIMKVIQPLFLDELREEYEKNIDNPKKLQTLILRMEKIRIFDPACWSGNFLVISYKELRRLEMDILTSLYRANILTLPISHISLSQFYGIEIDDFAHEIAGLSLYIANHQMNREFEGIFWQSAPLLPLKSSGNIVCANATRIEWETVCPKNIEHEIYVLGNPPYLWSRNQEDEQKEDMKYVFGEDYQSLDYIACWFYLWAKYIQNSQSKMALVSTNSLCQWEQVALIWPRVLWKNLEIFFAYPSFKWTNNAKKNAGVIVIIIWLRNIEKQSKRIYTEGKYTDVKNISPYLSEGSNVIVTRLPKSISSLPEMEYWNMPLEWTHLRLNKEEMLALIKTSPHSSIFIRKVIWWEEFLNSIERFCIWIDDVQLKEALKIKEIARRVDLVHKFRVNWWDVAKTLSNKSHQFRYRKIPKNSLILVPCTSSENRDYLPCGYFDNSYVTLNSAQAIYDAEPWIFWVISSRMHMVWMRVVAGRLKSDYRYSSALVYNTFPFPTISDKQKEAITSNVHNILTEREKHSEKTLAELYVPNKMPAWLKEAHHMLDELIERCYKATPFKSDEDRLSYLFNLYEKMVVNEKKTK